jgi:hypothetical protein
MPPNQCVNEGVTANGMRHRASSVLIENFAFSETDEDLTAAHLTNKI